MHFHSRQPFWSCHRRTFPAAGGDVELVVHPEDAAFQLEGVVVGDDFVDVVFRRVHLGTAADGG